MVAQSPEPLYIKVNPISGDLSDLYDEHVTSRKENKTDVKLILKSSVGLLLGMIWLSFVMSHLKYNVVRK